LAASKHILFAHLFLRESSFSFLGPSSAVPFCFVSVRSVRFSHVWQAEERAGFEEGTDEGRTLGPRFGSSRPPPPVFAFLVFFYFSSYFCVYFFITNMFHQLLLIGLSSPFPRLLDQAISALPFCVFTLTSIPLRLERAKRRLFRWIDTTCYVTIFTLR